MRLSDLDMDASVDDATYDAEMDGLFTSFKSIQQAYLRSGEHGVVVFEGWDAAGKGGAIRRMSSVMDPRGFKVWPIGAPSDEEKARHYLARFWDRLPKHGEIAVFDRSWYGRVLVERVEGFAVPEHWQRAYDEINAFETMLLDSGTRIAKIFLYIDRDEQARRFEKRLRDPLKRWKLTAEDLRNRERWDDYELAVNDMLERTDTPEAPWHVVPANQKKFARVNALSHVAARLSDGVDLSPPPPDPELEAQFQREIAGQ